MAFLQFMGGAAKRGLQKIEDNEAIIDKSINLFTQLGIPAYKARKELKKQNRQLAETLRDNGFGIDAIGTILSQGKGQKVVDYLDKMSAIGRKANVADVVTFLPEYKESGMTMDEMLESVVGKINRGMSMSDAVMDATGQKSETTFGKFFSGANRKLVEKRLSTYKSAFGEGMLNDLRALAVGDVSASYFPKESRGTISLYDPSAAALLASREDDKDEEIGFTYGQVEKFLKTRLNDMVGLDKAQSFNPSTGAPIFTGKEAQMQSVGNQIVDDILLDYEKKKKYDFQDRSMLLERLKNLYRNQFPGAGVTRKKQTPSGGGSPPPSTTLAPQEVIDNLLDEVRNSKSTGFNFRTTIPNEIEKEILKMQPNISKTKLRERVRELLLDAMK
jgi:hypothetical protein